MNLFNQENDMYEDDYYSRRPGIGGKILAFFLKLLFYFIGLPAFAVGAIHFYLMFARGRLRVSVITIITIVELLIIVPVIYINHPIRKILDIFKFNGNIDWMAILISYLMICLIIGLIGGYVLCCLKAFQFNNNPSLIFMDGWTANFSYRVTPWEALKRKYLKKAMSEGKFYSQSAAPLGILEEPVYSQVSEIDDAKESLKNTSAEIVSRRYSEAMKHTVATGETGSGKTVTMLSLMYNDIQNGFPICVVDFKKSPDVLYFLSKWAKDFGRDFYYFSGGDDSDKDNPFYGEKSTYDPFSSGEQNSRADVILSLRQWDAASDVYKGRTESLLIALFFALLNVNKEDVPSIPWDEGGLNQIISALDLRVMFDLIQAVKKEEVRRKTTNKPMSKTDMRRIRNLEEIYTNLKDKTPEGKGLKEQLEGIKLICNKLIMSSYGSWLSKGTSQKHIDLLKIATSNEGPIVLFALSPQEEEEFAKGIGTIIMSDLKRTSHTKNDMGNTNPFGLYIDEFQTIDPSDVTDLLEKSRSAKFFCTIASQSLEQIVVASKENGEATLKSVLDTCGNYIFHSGAKQDSAERMSKILGETKHIIRRASTKANTQVFSLNLFNQRQGVVNKEITDGWIIPPSKFQNLSAPNEENGYKSEAYVITKWRDPNTSATTFGAQRIQVIAQSEITQGLPEDFKVFIGQAAVDRHKRQTGEDISGYSGIKGVKQGEVEEDEMDILANSSYSYTEPIKETSSSVEDDNDQLDSWEIDEILDENASSESNDDLYSDMLDFSEPQTKPSNANTSKTTKSIKEETRNSKKLPEFESQKRPLTTYEKMQLEQKRKKETKRVSKDAEKMTVNDEAIRKKEVPFKLPEL